MSPPVTLTAMRGPEVAACLDDVARLRIAVFADWPYLYEGDAAYERDYLAAYARSPDSVFVLARHGGTIVGASTGLPLLDDAPAFARPFHEAGMDPSRVFYFGESVLLPAYRGRGLGHAFFDAREAHARALARFDTTAFCAVDRAAGDARCPLEYRSNEPFWHRRGYVRRPGLKLSLRWAEAGRGEIEHTLTFWTRPLEPCA